MVAGATATVLGAGAAGAESTGPDFRWNPAPVFTGDDWEAKIIGRVQFDYALVDADISGANWNEGELRGLRLGVSGNYGDNVKYKLELNTNSSGDVSFLGDVRWAPTGGAWYFKAGQSKTPNSLDEQTSSRFISTLERAAFTDAFEFNRRLGVSLNAKGEQYTLSAGAYGDSINALSQEDGFAVAARATVNPIENDDGLIHLGVSMRYRGIGDGQSDLRYRQRPFSHIPGRIISTGAIANADFFVGAEAAAIYKSFWAAGEYGVTFAECSAAAACADPTLQGAYGEAGIFLGGRKTYRDGKYDRPIVDNPITEGGMGALAFVARFDTIDLSDSGVNGGSYTSYILGADWWATKYTRLGVNLFKVDADLGSSTSGLDTNFAALVSGGTLMEDVTGVIARAQLDF